MQQQTQKSLEPVATRRGAVLWLPLVLCVLLVVFTVLSLLIGGRTNTFAEAWARIPGAFTYAFDPDRLSAEQRADDLVTVIGALRIPRTALAIVVGAALGAAGSLVQGYTRNPLAEPGVLGINAGAAVAVVVSIFLGFASSPSEYIFPALLGCAAVTACVFLLSSTGRTAANPLSIVLAGAALSGILMAIVNALVLSDIDALDQLRQWATGSVADRGLSTVWIVLPFIVVGLVLGMSQAPSLNMLAMGEAVAESLGLHVGRHRSLGLIAIALLGGAATAAAGPVSFIGLAAPHSIRAVIGPDYRIILPYSALLGATLALMADVAGRFIGRPGELQMGIVMALVGVPFFIALIRRGKVAAL